MGHSCYTWGSWKKGLSAAMRSIWAVERESLYPPVGLNQPNKLNLLLGADGFGVDSFVVEIQRV